MSDTRIGRKCWWGFAAVIVLLSNGPCCSAAEDGHPLDAAIEYARKHLSRLDVIRDYSAILIKRQRIRGKLSDHEFAFVKVRHEPFSVYMKFLKPEHLKGREVIYVEGHNEGKLLAHEPAFDKFGTVALEPDGLIAMRGELHPITKTGIKNLASELIVRAEAKKAKGTDCKVIFRKNAQIDDRSATVIEVLRTDRSQQADFYRARVYVDDELRIPVRYEVHDWPAKEGGQPILLEEYTYRNVRLNQGFDDTDFDIKNPKYDFPPLNLLTQPRKGLFSRDR